MERHEVYGLIEDERYYQDHARKDNERETRSDSEKSVADFILYIEHTLNRAKLAIYQLDELEAMANIRKLTALGVAAMETHETPPRTS